MGKESMRNYLISFMFLLSACADPDPCASMRDISLSAASLSLTRNEHPGWGNTECFQCHQRFSIHQNDCTAVAEVDAAAIDAMIDPADTTTCIQCHGSNGVAAWAHFEDSGGEE